VRLVRDGDAKVRWAAVVTLGKIAEEGVGECCQMLEIIAQVGSSSLFSKRVVLNIDKNALII
jgi:hypothetical protein